jgi:hypothetical protein
MSVPLPYDAFIDTYFEAQAKRTGDATLTSCDLKRRAKEFTQRLAAHNVLRIRGGMPSLMLSRDRQILVLFWPNLGPWDEFSIELTPGSHRCLILGTYKQDTEEVLIALLKDLASRPC